MVSRPTTGPMTIVQITKTVISAPASAARAPAPDTRYGTPQSSDEHHHRELGAHVTEEAEPGARPPPDLRAAGGRSPRSDTVGRRRPARPGALRTTASTSTAPSALPAAAAPKAADQPAPCSSAANGIADSTWPSWPKIAGQLGRHRHPAGREPARDQREHRRRTRSRRPCRPAPGPARRAAGRSRRRAASWPGDQQHTADHEHRPRAEAVDQQTGRDLRRDVDRDLDERRTATASPGLIWKRSAASRPATPSVVRCITART